MKGICSFSDASRDLGLSNALIRLQSHLYFSETQIYESGWRKRTETQDKPGHLWVPADCE